MSTDKRPSAFRERTLKLQERAFEFGARVLSACPQAYPDDPSRTIWRQLVRSAPSVAGNLEEADEAMSDADFICHMKRVLKETKESRKWLRFITRCKLANYTKVGNLEDEARQLASIFATIIKNRKANIANERSAYASRRT